MIIHKAMTEVLKSIIQSIDESGLAESNFEEISKLEIHSKFNSIGHPKICIKDYIIRIDRYAKCSEALYIVVLIFIDRIVKKNPTLLVSSATAHRYRFCKYDNFIRLIIVAITIADKVYSDSYYSNPDYAAIGGIAVDELNALELEFCLMMDFELYISEELYNEYYDKLLEFWKNVTTNKPSMNPEKTMIQNEEGEIESKVDTCGSATEI